MGTVTARAPAARANVAAAVAAEAAVAARSTRRPSTTASDGYGLWLDAAVKDNPVYAEHWAGKRDVTVRIDADQIVIRRAGAIDDDAGNGDDDDSDD